MKKIIFIFTASAIFCLIAILYYSWYDQYAMSLQFKKNPNDIILILKRSPAKQEWDLGPIIAVPLNSFYIPQKFLSDEKLNQNDKSNERLILFKGEDSFNFDAFTVEKISTTSLENNKSYYIYIYLTNTSNTNVNTKNDAIRYIFFKKIKIRN